MTALDDAASELYALAPEEFVGARTRLVKQAREARDRALAGEISALRRPTRTAWLVNALAREEPGAVGALLDLGDELRAAQDQRDGAALRALSARRRSQIDALVRRAAGIGREAGHPPTETTTNEVAQTLQAALGDPAVAAQVRGARLAAAVVYGGFGGAIEGSGPGGDDLAALLAASVPATTRSSGAKETAADREGREAAARRAASERARDDARAALDEAQAAADRATEEADARAADVERLTTELTAAEAAAREAAAAARTARAKAKDRRATADAAEQAYRAAL